MKLILNENILRIICSKGIKITMKKIQRNIFKMPVFSVHLHSNGGTERFESLPVSTEFLHNTDLELCFVYPFVSQLFSEELSALHLRI